MTSLRVKGFLIAIYYTKVKVSNSVFYKPNQYHVLLIGIKKRAYEYFRKPLTFKTFI